MKTTIDSVSTSLIVAVHADPRMPEAATYTESTTAPSQIAGVEPIDPYDVCSTMIPSPFSCSARYGIIAATATTDTRIPNARDPYADVNTSAWETSRRGVA